MTGVAPGLKFTFKGDDNLKGDLGVEYGIENTTLAGELDVVEFSNLRLSGVVAYQKFLVSLVHCILWGSNSMALIFNMM